MFGPRLSSVLLPVLSTALSCAGLAAQNDLSVDDALAKMRRAYGWEALAGYRAGWRITGRCREQGLEGKYRDLFKLDGVFSSERSTELGFVGGFDGTTAWLRDSSGVTRVLSLGSRDTALGSSWIDKGLWLEPGTERFELERSAAHSDAEVYAVTATLAGRPWRSTILVDRDTWLPTTILEERAGGIQRTELSDWRERQGFQVAHHVESTGIGGDVSTFDVEFVGAMPVYIISPFEPRRSPPQDTTFDPDVPSEIEVRATETGHLLVHPVIDGEDVGWFLIDSGAGMNCIDPAAADALGWEKLGETSVLGGGGATLGAFRGGGKLELGPITVVGPPWLELDLSALEPFFGVEVGGLVGYDLFARAVVEMDLSEHRIWLHDPQRWTPPENARELALDDTAPCIECTFAGGHEGWFRLDTGSDDTVAFHGPAVTRLRLGRGEGLQRVSVQGVAGVLRGRRGPIDWFELGGHRIEKPEVTFLEEGEGALNDETLLGNIGARMLHDFRVVFDLSRRQITFRPRK